MRSMRPQWFCRCPHRPATSGAWACFAPNRHGFRRTRAPAPPSNGTANCPTVRGKAVRRPKAAWHARVGAAAAPGALIIAAPTIRQISAAAIRAMCRCPTALQTDAAADNAACAGFRPTWAAANRPARARAGFRACPPAPMQPALLCAARVGSGRWWWGRWVSNWWPALVFRAI